MKKFLSKAGNLKGDGKPDDARTAMLTLFATLSLNAPTADQFFYLKEYLLIMQPVCSYLDVMQGESNTHFGCLLPILVKLRSKLRGLTLNVSTSKSLRDGLLVRLEARFGYLFQNDAHVIAAILHPRFKLNWLYFDAAKQEKYSDVIKKLIDTNCAEVVPNPPPEIPQVLTPAGTPVEDLLEFPVPLVKSFCKFEQYLNDSKEDLKMLDDYPAVKKLFIEYNTPTPSSAPVERLFSIANLILSSRRNRLSDLYFQHVLLLKIYFMKPDFMFST